jgi:hypothetical protein
MDAHSRPPLCRTRSRRFPQAFRRVGIIDISRALVFWNRLERICIDENAGVYVESDTTSASGRTTFAVDGAGSGLPD